MIATCLSSLSTGGMENFAISGERCIALATRLSSEAVSVIQLCSSVSCAGKIETVFANEA